MSKLLEANKHECVEKKKLKKKKNQAKGTRPGQSVREWAQKKS